MYTIVFLIFGCGPDKDSSIEEPLDTSDSYTEDTSESHSTNPNAIRPFCRRQTYKSYYNGELTSDITYSWDGFSQEAEDWYAEYNDYGYITKSNSTYDGYISNVINSYECDGWCKVLSSYYEGGSSAEELDVTETEYTWEDNTQYQSTNGLDASRFWVYNDMGYVIEYYDEGSGYNTTSRYEYSCDDHWCKLEKTTTILQMEGQEATESIVEHEWNGNQNNFDGGYKRYNEYGYLIAIEFSSPGSISLEEFTYQCDPE